MSEEKKIKKGARVRLTRAARPAYAASLAGRVGVVDGVGRKAGLVYVQFRHRAGAMAFAPIDLEVV